MTILETLNELDALYEQSLTEKLWVAIRPKGTNNYYRFLTVNDKTAQIKDITDMLGERKGTYKQTLDRKILNELIQDLKNASNKTGALNYSDPKNYTLEDPGNIDKNLLKTLTLSDRTLRKDAQKVVKGLRETNPDLNAKLGNNSCLIHHINGHEDENELKNLVLVPYLANNDDNLKIAHGIHSLLHVTAKDNIKSSPLKHNTDLYYFDNNGEVKKGKCSITIALK